jgi:hypothetical protein
MKGGVKVTATKPVSFKTKEILFNGDETRVEAGSWQKGSSNVQYRWTSFNPLRQRQRGEYELRQRQTLVSQVFGRTT